MRHLLLLLLYFLQINTTILWSGNVTTNAFSFTLSSTPGDTILVSRNEDLSAPIYSTTALEEVTRVYIQGLSEGTRYYYGREGDVGTVMTFSEHMQNIRILVASCATTGSNSIAFEAMENWDADLFVHMGDLHYSDIAVNDRGLFDEAYRGVFENVRQKSFFGSTPIAYVWDDHDFGPNNADSTSPSKEAAQASYRINVPHYPLDSESGSIYQAFDIGNVRVIMSDLRSESNKKEKSIMDPTQKAWLKNEFSKHRDYLYLIWVNPQPWIGPPSQGDDNWMGFIEDRSEISNFIAENNIQNLFSVSGDAHMVAIDDGTHSDYSNGTAGFPVFQAAALDRPGSSKGGPYSEGCYAYDMWRTMQYGMVEIEDNGSLERSCVTFSGYRELEKEPLVSWTKCGVLVIDGEPGDGSCSIELMPAWAWVVVCINIIVFLVLVVIVIAGWKKLPSVLKIIGTILIVANIMSLGPIIFDMIFPVYAAIIFMSLFVLYALTLCLTYLTYPDSFTTA